MLTKNVESHTETRFPILALGYVALGLSWLVVFMLWAAITEGRLAPWDTTHVRPAPGTVERALNDFFEGSPGFFLPASLILGASLFIFVRAHTRRPTRRTELAWGFALSNLLLMVLVTLAAMVASNVTFSFILAVPPLPEVGYHKTLPGFFAILGVTVLWLGAQVALAHALWTDS